MQPAVTRLILTAMWHSGGPSTTGRLCHHWHRTGTCSYGDRCRFIHTHTTALDTTHGGGGPGVPASSAGAAGTPPHPFGGGTPHAQHFYHQGQGRPRHDGSTSSTPSYHQHPQQHGAPGGGAGGGAQRGYYSSSSYSGRSSSYQQQRAPYSSRPTSAYSYSSQTWGGGGGGGHSLGEDLAPPFTQREWVAPQGVAACQAGEEVELRVMTYNLLADQLAHDHKQELYTSTPHHLLDWDRHRWPLALREVQHWQPDVLCLQEVDHWPEVQQALAALGYEGQYAQRSGQRADGCATFWRTSRVSLVASQVVHMRDHNLKDNVALITALQPRLPDGATGGGPPPRSLLVANTHVLFNNKRGDVKVGQMRTALQSLLDMAARTFPDTSTPRPACIYTGDFNTAPGSGVYDFLLTGQLDLHHHDRRNMSGQNEGYGFRQYLRDLRSGARGPLQGYVPPTRHPLDAPETTLSPAGGGGSAAAGGGNGEGPGDAVVEPLVPGRASRKRPQGGVVEPLCPEQDAQGPAPMHEGEGPAEAQARRGRRAQGQGSEARAMEVVEAGEEEGEEVGGGGGGELGSPSSRASSRRRRSRSRVAAEGGEVGPTGSDGQPPQRAASSGALASATAALAITTTTSTATSTVTTTTTITAAAAATPGAAAVAVVASVQQQEGGGAVEEGGQGAGAGAKAQRASATPLQQFRGPLPADAYAPWQHQQQQQQQGGEDSEPLTPSVRQPAAAPPGSAPARLAGGAAVVTSVEASQLLTPPGGAGGGDGQVVQQQRVRRAVVWEEEELEAAMGVEAARQLVAELTLQVQRDSAAGGRVATYKQRAQVQVAVAAARAEQGAGGLLVARHPLVLRSAYVEATGAEPPFTTCHQRCMDTVDYQWFTPFGCPAAAAGGHDGGDGGAGPERPAAAGGGGGVLRVLRALQVPAPALFTHGMPCRNWASDHVSLCVDYALRLR